MEGVDGRRTSFSMLVRRLLILVSAIALFAVSPAEAAPQYKSLAKDCWDAAEPFNRSPLVKYPNGTAVAPDSAAAQPVEPVRPGRAQDSKIRLGIDADAYRIGQVVKITVSSDTAFEAYMVTVASTNARPSDEHWPGNFVPSSDMSQQVMLACGEHVNSGAASGPERGDFTEVTATWFAPDTDVGAVFFRVAVLRGNQFWTNETARLLFYPYPPPIDMCGVSQFCLRRCEHEITNCPSSEAEIVYVQNKWEGVEPMTVIMGGIASGDEDFVAMGYTSDKEQLTNADVTVCARPMNNSTTMTRRPVLEHYLMEKIEYGPKKSGLNEGSENFRLDLTSTTDDSRVWCKFTRPVAGPARKTLDLRKNFYRFFFSGSRDSNGDIVIPRKSAMLMSATRYNVSRVADIYYFGSSAQGIPGPARGILIFGILLAGLCQHRGAGNI